MIVDLLENMLKQIQSLNPYCNGCTSMIEIKQFDSIIIDSLNPYCNGCTSMILPALWEKGGGMSVSILIVMDVLQ